MVKLFLDAGVIALTAFISPLAVHRDMVQRIIGRENMIEIYCNCPLEICEQRDVKGLYKKARAGIIPNYTGISSPFQKPLSPDMDIDTARLPVNACVERIIAGLKQRGIIP